MVAIRELRGKFFRCRMILKYQTPKPQLVLPNMINRSSMLKGLLAIVVWCAGILRNLWRGRKYMSDGNTERKFVVVLRGPAAVVFPDGLPIQMTVHSEYGPLAITYASRRIKVTDSSVCPGHMWIDIRGGSPTLDDALALFPQAGLLLQPLLALSANAAVSHPEIELGFETTLGITERDFFQQYVPPERTGALRAGRLIDVQATLALMEFVSESPHRDRLLRAMGQYQISLENWTLGGSILAVSHLWMAVEALTKVRVRVEMELRKLREPAELAEKLGVEIKKLDSTIRRDFIFRGDSNCYSKALEASDGFEHGFSAVDELRHLTSSVRDKTAEYVRREIFALSDLPQEVTQHLLASPFNEPQGPGMLAKYFFGKLVGSGESLAKVGNEYPILQWKQTINSTHVNDSKKMTDYNVTDLITPELADGISFKAERHEIWKP